MNASVSLTGVAAIFSVRIWIPMIQRCGTISSSSRCPSKRARLTNLRCRGVAARELSPRFAFATTGGRCLLESVNGMWHDFLVKSMSFKAGQTDELAMSWRGGPGTVATVCVRDHWGEMSAGEREWCVDRVCHEVMESAERS